MTAARRTPRHAAADGARTDKLVAVVWAVVWTTAVAPFAGCDAAAPPAVSDLPPAPAARPADLVVLPASIVVRHGPVGMAGADMRTFAYVDVENRGPVDHLVRLDGMFVDAAGKEVEVGDAGELRIPGGATRTFALVAPRVLDTATAARFTVRQARGVGWPEPVVLREVTVVPPPAAAAAPNGITRGRLRVEGQAHNPGSRAALASIIATFYDGGGAIVARPFLLREVPAGASLPFAISGPPGAVRAAVFVGDVSY